MTRDLRTRSARREEILEQIRQHGGFSIFWVTENPLRARVATDMHKSGEILLDRRKVGRFPWTNAEIAPNPKH